MKLYRLLLSFYPARFREEYGGPLEQQFADEYRDAQSSTERARLWLRALLDLSWSIPVELAAELRQDLAHSLRVHARRPFLMLFTVTILALAIGGATGVFSVVNAVLIKALPFRDPSRLVVLSNFVRGFDDSPATFHRWRTSSRYLSDAASSIATEMNVTGPSWPQRVTVVETSYNFFSALGSEPVLGRAFVPGEDYPGNNAVAVISYSLWQQMFGGDPRVLGQKLLLNGAPVSIVGVARPGLDYPAKASVWTPTVFDLDRLPKAGVFGLQTFGRLKPGLTLAQASQMYQAEALALQPAALSAQWASRPKLVPMQTQLGEKLRQASLVLMAAIVFVLLIACGNVANLLLTRTAERRDELVVRAALGASRARLMQQLLSESIFLSVIAAMAGIAVAVWVAKLAALAQPPELAAQQYTILDWRVLLFAIGLALVTGILFGAAPSWAVRYLQPSGDALRAHASPRSSKLRGFLIAAQVALTLALLTGSITMARGLMRVLSTDVGFHTDRIVTLSASLASTRDESDDREAAYLDSALARLRALDGVESAAATDFLPLDASFFPGGNLVAEGRQLPGLVICSRATPDYFRAMGIKLIYGREFTEADRAPSARVAIVTEETARQIAEGASVIGRTVTLKGDKDGYTIVGVAAAVRYMGPEQQQFEQLIRPARRLHMATFIAHVRGDARDALALCRDAVQSVDPQVPVFNVKTLEQRLDDTLSTPRFRTTVFLFFGGFALLLAIAGIYGVSSYSVALRRREIGVRIAVGATPQRVRGMMLRQALAPIAVGIAVGIAGAAWQGSLLQHLLTAAPPIDLAACAACAALLALVAVAAIWTATGRVASLNPIAALRSE